MHKPSSFKDVQEGKKVTTVLKEQGTGTLG